MKLSKILGKIKNEILKNPECLQTLTHLFTRLLFWKMENFPGWEFPNNAKFNPLFPPFFWEDFSSRELPVIFLGEDMLCV